MLSVCLVSSQLFSYPRPVWHDPEVGLALGCQSGRRERRRDGPGLSPSAGLGHVLKNVAVLQAQRGYGREHALDEAPAGLALSSDAGLPPDDGMAERALRRVVRWFDSRDTHECPQGSFDLEDLLAHP